MRQHHHTNLESLLCSAVCSQQILTQFLGGLWVSPHYSEVTGIEHTVCSASLKHAEPVAPLNIAHVQQGPELNPLAMQSVEEIMQQKVKGKQRWLPLITVLSMLFGCHSLAVCDNSASQTCQPLSVV